MTDTHIRTHDGGTTDVASEELAALSFAIRGRILHPGDEGYDEARRLWNGMFDRRPALIVQCAGPSDVIETVNFARKNGLLFTVKGGGHGMAGHAAYDDALMIDLSPMRGIRVDPVARTVHAQAGCTWGDVDRETQAFSLAVPGGVVADTGIAGLTLGGGYSWIRRKYGMGIDCLLSVDVVTADGRYVTASESQNEDLFWAAPGRSSCPGVVDEDMAHDLCGYRIEMRASLDSRKLQLRQPDVRFVDQSLRIQGMVAPFAPEPRPGDLHEVVIHRWDDFVQHFRIAIRPGPD